jgi:hypothetical protein
VSTPEYQRLYKFLNARSVKRANRRWRQRNDAHIKAYRQAIKSDRHLKRKAPRGRACRSCHGTDATLSWSYVIDLCARCRSRGQRNGYCATCGHALYVTGRRGSRDVASCLCPTVEAKRSAAVQRLARRGTGLLRSKAPHAATLCSDASALLSLADAVRWLEPREATLEAFARFMRRTERQINPQRFRRLETALRRLDPSFRRNVEEGRVVFRWSGALVRGLELWSEDLSLACAEAGDRAGGDEEAA